MSRIKVPRPLVEMDGDEMARIVWRMIKDRFIEPYIDVDLRYFDLSLPKRDKTEDRVTVEAARALKEYGIGVKCPTISVDQARMKEFGLKQSECCCLLIYNLFEEILT
jgi:isocitrate dehydrogenase